MEKSETALAVLETSQLDEVLTGKGIELTDAEAIKQSYIPYFEQMAKIKKESAKINFDNPSELDEKIARELRLRTVKIRTGSMSVKEERKKIHALKANLEQSAWNLIKTSCELDEEIFLQVEKKREIAENARKESVKADRISKLLPFGVDVQFIDLLNMPDEAFEKLLAQSELAFEQAKQEVIKAENERVERERIAEEKRQEMILENKRLREEAEVKEKALAEERKKAEQEAKAIADKAAKELADAKAKADAEQKKMREEAQKKLDAERKERERVESELKEKQDAELKAKADAEAFAESELSKGDAEKFQDLIKELEALTTKFTFKSKKFKTAYAGCVELLNKTINYLISKQ